MSDIIERAKKCGATRDDGFGFGGEQVRPESVTFGKDALEAFAADIRNEQADMANVGTALMEAIKIYADKGWHPMDCPSEIVGDLHGEREELRAEVKEQATKIEYLEAYIEAQKESFDEIAQANIVLQAKIAMQHNALNAAMQICDAIPSHAHELDDSSPLQRLGCLNNQDDGCLGYYAIIRDTLSATEQDVAKVIAEIEARGAYEAAARYLNNFKYTMVVRDMANLIAGDIDWQAKRAAEKRAK